MRHPKLLSALTIVAVLIAYLAGFKFLLPIVLIIVSAVFLPLPKIFNTWFNRIIVSLMLNICFLQAASLVQQVIAPQSNFIFIAIVYSLIGIGISLFCRPNPLLKVIGARDLYSLIGVVIFIAPFLGVIFAQDQALQITKIGGLQSPDAGHHFDYINSMIHEQHLDYSGYPKSFHLGLGFLQEALVGTQKSLGWQDSALVFFGQYLIFGSLLAFALYFLCLAFFKKLNPNGFKTVWQNCAFSLALALPLVLFTLWPFLGHGFLNYYFTIAAVAIGIICLLNGRWTLAVVAFFGAVASWTLVAPALFLTLILFWPSKKIFGKDGLNLTPKTSQTTRVLLAGPPLNLFYKYIKKSEAAPPAVTPFIKGLWSHVSLKLLLGLLILAFPVVMQLIYPPTTAEIHASGALRTLHVLVLASGLFMIAYYAIKSSAPIKKVATAIFLPMFILVGSLVVLHLFVLGEVRYYPIKVALLLEVLLLVWAVAVLFSKSLPYSRVNVVIGLTFMPLLTLLFLVAPHPSPLKDVRDLFRDYSSQGKPAYYDQDAFYYSKLAKEEKLNNFNSIVLHYNPSEDKLSGHALLTQWVHSINYSRDDTKRSAWNCHRALYKILSDGKGTPEEQQQLREKIKECAQTAHQNGQDYYIITDNNSVDDIRSIFKESAKYVSS